MITAFVAVFGLLWGSFANVLIARVPQNEPWITEPSRCPRCKIRIAWYDNVPVVSWLLLRGRCRSCREPISPRYIIVEIATSAAFVGVYLAWGATITSLAFAFLALISIVLVAIDIDVRRLPDAIVFPSYVIGGVLLIVGALAAGEPWALVRALVGALILGGFYGLMWLVYPAGMGFGDVKTAGLLGLFAGFLSWSTVALAWFAGPMLGGLFVIGGLATKRLGRKSKVPYGPALIIGAWIGYFAGDSVIAAYLGLFDA
jgi:leader peptidase (prepilin peptidase)/N-methyltransferase